MAFELIYTSMPRGVKLGSSGFCTVAYTNGLAANYITQLERMSAYKPCFPHYDEHATENPVAYSHYIISTSGMTAHILSRVCFYGLDYTKRSNKLAHHIVLTANEAATAAGPAAICLNRNLFRTEWNDEPQLFAQQKTIEPPAVCSHIASVWAEYTGDAGWAGTLAQSFIDSPSKPVFIVYDPLKHKNILNLVEEALQLLPADKRWQVSYNTYFYSVPAGVQCNWRFCVADPDVLREARRVAGTLIIDLTKELPPAGNGKLENSARSGIVEEQKAPLYEQNTNASKIPEQLIFPSGQSQRVKGPAVIPNKIYSNTNSGRYETKQSHLQNERCYTAPSSCTSFKIVLSVIIFVAVLLTASVFLFGKKIMQQCGMIPSDTLDKQVFTDTHKENEIVTIKSKKPSDKLSDGRSSEDDMLIRQAQKDKREKEKSRAAVSTKKPVEMADTKKVPVQIAEKKSAVVKNKKPAVPVVPNDNRELIINNQQSFWRHYSVFTPQGKLSRENTSEEFSDILLKGETVAEVYIYNNHDKREERCEKNGDLFSFKEAIGGFGSTDNKHSIRANYEIKCIDRKLCITNKNSEAKAKNYRITKMKLTNGSWLYCNFIPGKSIWPKTVSSNDKLIIRLPDKKRSLSAVYKSDMIKILRDAWDEKKHGPLSLYFLSNKKNVASVDAKNKFHFDDKSLPGCIKTDYLVFDEAKTLTARIKSNRIKFDREKIKLRKGKLSKDITDKKKETKNAEKAYNSADEATKNAKKAEWEKIKGELTNLEKELEKWGKNPSLEFTLNDLQSYCADNELDNYSNLFRLGSSKKATFFDVNKDKKLLEIADLALKKLHETCNKEKGALKKIEIGLYYRSGDKKVLLHNKVRFEVQNGK